MIVSEDIIKDKLPKGKVDPCVVCSLTAKANSVLCLQYSKWIHTRCVEVKRVITVVIKSCLQHDRHDGKAIEQDNKLCN